MKYFNTKTKVRGKILGLFGVTLLLTICMCFTVFGETLPTTDPGWYVTVNTSGKIESNFQKDTLDQYISNIQPGDKAIFTITVKNQYSGPVDWYMDNIILYSLEERSANSNAKGAGYTYILTYQKSGSSVPDDIFRSDKVGGNDISDAGIGLKEAGEGLEDMFLLESMEAGKSGIVTLQIVLDGETGGNSYQDTFADLQFDFAVEFPETKTVIKEVTKPKTGDNTQITLYLGLMGGAAVLVVLMILVGVMWKKNTKKTTEGGEKK